MDLGLAWSNDGARTDATVAALESLGWAAAALEVSVAADPGAARALRDGRVGEGEHDWRKDLPTLEALQAACGGAFRTVPYSERERDGPDRAFERYSRLTVHFCSPSSLQRVLAAPEAQLFDLVAAQPTTPDALKAALSLVQSLGEGTPFDVLVVDIGESRAFSYTLSVVHMVALRKAKIFLDLRYTAATGLVAEDQQAAVVDAVAVTRHVSKGHLRAKGRFCNVLLTSGSKMRPRLRKVETVAKLGEMFGLSADNALASVTTSAEAALRRAERRRRAAR